MCIHMYQATRSFEVIQIVIIFHLNSIASQLFEMFVNSIDFRNITFLMRLIHNPLTMRYYTFSLIGWNFQFL